MKRIAILLSSLLLLLTGCGGNTSDSSYEQITQEAAKEMMDTEEVIILDVREQDEYDSSTPQAVDYDLLLINSVPSATPPCYYFGVSYTTRHCPVLH